MLFRDRFPKGEVVHRFVGPRAQWEVQARKETAKTQAIWTIKMATALLNTTQEHWHNKGVDPALGDLPDVRWTTHFSPPVESETKGWQPQELHGHQLLCGSFVIWWWKPSWQPPSWACCWIGFTPRPPKEVPRMQAHRHHFSSQKDMFQCSNCCKSWGGIISPAPTNTPMPVTKEVTHP